MPYLIHFPGVKSLIKHSIFDQFCGGENLEECQQTIDKLHQHHIGSILDYSIEGKEEESAYDNCHKEILEIIDLAKGNPAIPFVVFKPTGFGNINIYEKIGNKKELNTEEQQQWERILHRFETVCQKAHKNQVTLMVDAEESWMQDAADDLVLDLMRKYNQERCIVVNTLQMYRHDRLAYLKEITEIAKKENFYIGFKIVRGAYMEKERARAIEQGYPSPIQRDKAATDRDYNLAIEFIVQHIDRVSLFAGTHNEHSCDLLIKQMEQNQITPNYHKIWFGQLLGMSDNISFVIANQGMNIAKYVPYGPVKEVIPYLIRRAQENTSVAGQSSRELGLIERELKRRKK